MLDELKLHISLSPIFREHNSPCIWISLDVFSDAAKQLIRNLTERTIFGSLQESSVLSIFSEAFLDLLPAVSDVISSAAAELSADPIDRLPSIGHDRSRSTRAIGIE